MSVVDPSIRDHADFMVPGGAGSLALIDQTVNDTTVHTFPVLDVSSWEVLQISLDWQSGPVGQYEMIIEWFASSQVQAGHQLCIKNIEFNNGDSIRVSFPNYGPNFRITISPPAVAAWSVFLFVNARNGDPDVHALRNGPLIVRGSINVAAGGVNTTVATIVTRGLACLTWLMDNTSFILAVDALTASGGVQASIVLLTGATVGTADTRLIAIPSTKVQLRLINTAGAAQNMSGVITMV